jgi:hypothetical protein
MEVEPASSAAIVPAPRPAPRGPLGVATEALLSAPPSSALSEYVALSAHAKLALLLFLIDAACDTELAQVRDRAVEL